MPVSFIQIAPAVGVIAGAAAAETSAHQRAVGACSDDIAHSYIGAVVNQKAEEVTATAPLAGPGAATVRLRFQLPDAAGVMRPYEARCRVDSAGKVVSVSAGRVEEPDR